MEALSLSQREQKVKMETNRQDFCHREYNNGHD